jgi:hypothetical protein
VSQLDRDAATYPDERLRLAAAFGEQLPFACESLREIGEIRLSRAQFELQRSEPEAGRNRDPQLEI